MRAWHFCTLIQHSSDWTFLLMGHIQGQEIGDQEFFLFKFSDIDYDITLTAVFIRHCNIYMNILNLRSDCSWTSLIKYFCTFVKLNSFSLQKYEWFFNLNNFPIFNNYLKKRHKSSQTRKFKSSDLKIAMLYLNFQKWKNKNICADLKSLNFSTL